MSQTEYLVAQAEPATGYLGDASSFSSDRFDAGDEGFGAVVAEDESASLPA